MNPLGRGLPEWALTGCSDSENTWRGERQKWKRGVEASCLGPEEKSPGSEWDVTRLFGAVTSTVLSGFCMRLDLGRWVQTTKHAMHRA